MATSHFPCSLTVTLVALLGLHGHHVLASEGADSGTTEIVVETALNNTKLDFILEDLTDTYNNTNKVDEFWYPTVSGTGNFSRQVVKVGSITEKHIPGNFIEWKSCQLGLKQVLVGLTPSSVEIFDSATLQKTASKDISGENPYILQIPKTMELFTQCDADAEEENSPVMIILVAVATERPRSPSIVVLQSDGVSSIQEIGTFGVGLYLNVKSLAHLCVGSHGLTLIVPEVSDFPYLFHLLLYLEVNDTHAQFTFYKDFYAPGIASALVHQPAETAYPMVIIAEPGLLNIYNAFGLLHQQTLVTRQDCDNMFAFTLMHHHHHHYVACLAKKNDELQNVQFISYNPDTEQYEDKDAFKEIVVKELFPIAIEGSLGVDTVLLSRNATTGAVNILVDNGQGEFEVGAACSNVSVSACSEATKNYSKGAVIMIDDDGGGTTTTPMVAVVLPTPENSTQAPLILFSMERTEAKEDALYGPSNL